MHFLYRLVVYNLKGYFKAFISNSIKMPKIGKNAIKEVKDMYSDKYKTLLKQSKNQNNGKDIPWLWILKINVVNMATVSKSIHIFSLIPMKILTAFFFFWNVKNLPKIYMILQGMINSQTYFEKQHN